MTEPRFLTLEEVCELHRLQLEAFGGIDGIRDRGTLESAVAQASMTFSGAFVHAGLFEMAAAYAFHIAQNQCFLDGNKRTGLFAALVFLALNDREIPADDPRLYDAMIGIAERRMTKADLARLFERLAGAHP